MKNVFAMPQLKVGQYVTTLPLNRRLQQVALDDIAAFATLALEHPKRFKNKRIELASEALTPEEVIEIISKISGKPSEDLFPEVQTIKLLIRKVNEGGRKFYEGIGFSDFEYNRKENFVDLSLLIGLQWVKN